MEPLGEETTEGTEQPVDPALVARIGHDLNNILTIIDASIYFLAQREQSPAERENLADLRTALVRGKALAAELFAAAGRR